MKEADVAERINTLDNMEDIDIVEEDDDLEGDGCLSMDF